MCAQGVQTATTGSVSIDNCTWCDGSSCNSKGQCSVVDHQFLVCQCDFGYSGAGCQLATTRDLIVGVCIGVPGLLLVLGLVLVFRRRSRQARLYKSRCVG